jgi:septal ring factor EnvC (AmiA/AmiB activator)
MNALIRRREALVSETESERQAVEARLQQLADEADTLLELLDRLIEETPVEAPVDVPVAEAEPAPPPTPAELEAAAVATALAEGRALVHGQVASRLSALPVFDGVIMPASGEIIVRYGQPDASGITSRGLTLSPYPGAPVVAPLDGEVRFAGQFKGYGRLLILEHAGGYHSLIAGFGRLDARAGQRVLAGEPVGVTALPQSGDTDNPDLYFEFRSNGQPINPVQGLALARESVRG